MLTQMRSLRMKVYPQLANSEGVRASGLESKRCLTTRHANIRDVCVIIYVYMEVRPHSRPRSPSVSLLASIIIGVCGRHLQ